MTACPEREIGICRAKQIFPYKSQFTSFPTFLTDFPIFHDKRPRCVV